MCMNGMLQIYTETPDLPSPPYVFVWRIRKTGQQRWLCCIAAPFASIDDIEG